MEQFTMRLNNIEDSYYGFIAAVLTYVKNKPSRLNAVNEYLDSHPKAMTSDILEFISNQDDFYEDSVINNTSQMVMG